ncbi:MAG: ATP-binding protein [Myxococcota bacterium]
MADFERLGAFYLGRPLDAAGETRPEPLLYDARDLQTHAVCVGMTGSGKTGLCIGLLEEAAIDGIPAIAIDLKGDLGNLLLTFPKLRPKDFAPWIDPGDAARKGRSVEEHAAAMASLWKKGLADWGQGPERIRRYESAVERTLYTPGSSAGVPLAVVRGFGTPDAATLADPVALADKAEGASRALLALLGKDAADGPDRAQVFLANLLQRAWQEGGNLDLGGLVRAVLDPPIRRIGVLDLDTFFPAKAREALALELNALLGSPTFARWLAGEPLSAQRLLHTEGGRPRLSVVSLAHLDERERMFVLTLLLTDLIAWMRRQPGTTSLRAILYIDEIFGLMPPVREPASKRLLLTLLKQARAYGLGLVLATQNPVDLDYKGLSNCGTWFLGRLQTARDVDRVMDGLTAASQGAALEPAALRKTLAGLESRQFLLQNVHEDGPVLFRTRWVLSYLRGPMTEAEIARLVPREGKAPAGPVAAAAGAGVVAPGEPAAALPAGLHAERPALPATLEGALGELFVGEPVGEFAYRPCLWGEVQLRFAHRYSGLDVTETRRWAAMLHEDSTPAGAWKEAEPVPEPLPPLRDEPVAGGAFHELPRGVLTKSGLRSAGAALKRLAASEELHVPRCEALKLWGEPGQPVDAFAAAVRQNAREERDREVAKVRERYGKRLARAAQKLERAKEKVAREKGQASQQKLDTALGVGTTILGAIFGRGSMAGHATRAARTARRAGRMKQQQDDVGRAEEAVEEAELALEELKVEAQEALADVPVEMPEITTVAVRPRKSDLVVERLALAWVPVAR